MTNTNINKCPLKIIQNKNTYILETTSSINNKPIKFNLPLIDCCISPSKYLCNPNKNNSINIILEESQQCEFNVDKIIVEQLKTNSEFKDISELEFNQSKVKIVKNVLDNLSECYSSSNNNNTTFCDTINKIEGFNTCQINNKS